MLETVKETIKRVPNIPFSVLYSRYVMQVQDTNLAEEFRFFVAQNRVDTKELHDVLKITDKALMSC